MSWSHAVTLIGIFLGIVTIVYLSTSVGIAPGLAILLGLSLPLIALLRWIRGRWPEFVATGEDWSARHPWLNGAIFGSQVGLGLLFIRLIKGGSLVEALVSGVIVGVPVFFVFARWTKQWARRREGTD